MSSYSNIKTIYSLKDVLTYLKGLKNLDDVAVWLDWDENIINSNTNQIIEPQITKELFDFMLDNKMFVSIITGRFYDTACDDSKRNLTDMQYNALYTMFPILKSLGVNTELYSQDINKKTFYKVRDESGRCVGLLYMGIFFTGEKGNTIKHYRRQTGINKKINIFVDDYEPYLMETTKSFPDIVAFRRLQ